ncbi:TIGR03619 family F420-dependent LLM class oxidoreductase [Mycobacterium sp. NPDC050551]|uniref:TIGR03619 family F420-dependent LLM class oxidoreductase n=1 Tax=Mycobacterium sp. NPDC050551 TaxID=3155407 RepID=UPI003424A9D3
MKMMFAMPHAMELLALTQPWEFAVTGADQARMARCAEELGFDMISVPEHFLIPRAHVELSGAHYLHSTVAQAFFAGATTTIRLNSAATLLPLQHPAVMAKAIATADWLSGGRMSVTFGVGWLKEEFDLLGVPFHERGQMADEYLAAIIELWTQESPSFSGRYVSFDDVAFEPKPIQRPHPPVWIGGDADAALKRAARFASGWLPFLTQPADFPARIDLIKSQPTYDGRPFEVAYGVGTSLIGEGHEVVDDPGGRPGMTAAQLVDQFGHLHEQGVTLAGVSVPDVGSVDAYLDYCRWLIEEVAPQVP